MRCDRAKMFIDFHGNVIVQHVADRDFDVNSLVQHLRAKKWSWEQLFYNFYALLLQSDCVLCG